MDYQTFLNQWRDREGNLMSPSRIIHHLSGLKHLLRYLGQYGLLTKDLSLVVKYPKSTRGLPTAGMTHKEVITLIEKPGYYNERSIRDRTLLELFYSSGARLNEITQLKLKHINLSSGMIRIDTPKGGKEYERVIPIGKKAREWIDNYLRKVRKKYATPQSTHLFINAKGNPYSTSYIGKIIKNYLSKKELKQKIVTHSFRVSCATEMLRKGANVKVVQEQLGHRSIQSTERYLRLVPGDLKKAHTKYHPRS
jgi:integrase/recombinase XerD